MKNIKRSVAIKILSVLVIITSITIYLISPSTESPFSLISDCISISITTCSVASFLFCKYLWKWRIFKGWFVQIPNLNGAWSGSLTSSWEDCRTIDVSLDIKQSLLDISCVLNTGESKSESISCNFIIDNVNQKNQLSYIYLNIPRLTYRDKSPMHYGSVILDIESNTLTGNYWTDRKTTGCLKLSKK